ncbi:peptidase inhibitor family I36 protein [[Kitasatospora] papulosa]|uniref:peptidase inhibitor family I36 protein n=1 Tax=[Kitasatospora] papulosa TaxID=1464011 RepID=UPI0036760C09
MHPFSKAIIVTLSLSATLTTAACSSDSGTAESGKSGKSIKVEKRDTESNSLGGTEGNTSTTVCDAGKIEPKLPEDQIVPKVPGDETDPNHPDDEIVPKLPECARDDTINPRLSDDHGCLDGAICAYRDPNFSGPSVTFDLHRSFPIAVKFMTESGVIESTYARFSDGTLVNDQISSIINNSDEAAVFRTESDWTGGKIEVNARSENSNLSEWGMNDVISSLEAARRDQGNPVGSRP